MRGEDVRQGALFSYVDLEDRVPSNHPLRRMKLLVDGILRSMSAEFNARYARTGRPSVPPERLLRALLLQVLYTVRSERQLMEQLDYNLLYRWFVGLGVDDPVWDRTVFCAHRDRLWSEGAARDFFDRGLAIAEWQQRVSEEHFSIDGTLSEAWASHKSFVRKDGSGPEKPAGRNPTVDFTGEKRGNATHQSTTDPDARLDKKGEYTEAKLRYITHALAENRHGRIVDVETTQAHGHAEAEAAATLITRSVPAGGTVAADKGYDRADGIAQMQAQGVKPHVARKAKGRAVDGRTARGQGYAQSLSRRKMVEEAFGGLKTVGGFRKTRHRGLAKVSGQAVFCFAAYNLTRLLNLLTFVPVARAAPA